MSDTLDCADNEAAFADHVEPVLIDVLGLLWGGYVIDDLSQPGQIRLEVDPTDKELLTALETLTDEQGWLYTLRNPLGNGTVILSLS